VGALGEHRARCDTSQLSIGLDTSRLAKRSRACCTPKGQTVSLTCTTFRRFRPKLVLQTGRDQVGFFLFPLDLFERGGRECRPALPLRVLLVAAAALPSAAVCGSFSGALGETVSPLASASRGWTGMGSKLIGVAGARFAEPAAAACRKRGGRLGPRPRCWFLGAGAAFTSATETGSSGTGKPESTK
jgi:hypothetical protein